MFVPSYRTMQDRQTARQKESDGSTNKPHSIELKPRCKSKSFKLSCVWFNVNQPVEKMANFQIFKSFMTYLLQL